MKPRIYAARIAARVLLRRIWAKSEVKDPREVLRGALSLAARELKLNVEHVPAIPGTRLGLMLSQAEPVVGRRLREVILRRRAACEELDRTPLNLALARPAISKEKVLLIAGMYDLMGWGAPIELWQSWGQPNMWRLPEGHISTALTALMPCLPGRILRWLAPRLEAGRKNTT